MRKHFPGVRQNNLPMTAPHLLSSPIRRADYQLADNLWASTGSIFLTGTQALVRVLVMQGQHDAARGLHTQGFVSGYRGYSNRSR